MTRDIPMILAIFDSAAIAQPGIASRLNLRAGIGSMQLDDAAISILPRLDDYNKTRNEWAPSRAATERGRGRGKRKADFLDSLTRRRSPSTSAQRTRLNAETR